MPTKPKIDREQILDAAFQLVREQGHEALRVRPLAARLGCSTQPVLYQFATVEELRRETYRRADAFHTAYLLAGLEESGEPLLELGLRYIRFAAEEKPLFRFLFQTDAFAGRSLEELIAAPEAAPLLALTARESGKAEGEAQVMFRTLFTCVHGYASLLANNAMDFDPAAAEASLLALYRGLLNAQEEEK